MPSTVVLVGLPLSVFLREAEKEAHYDMMVT